mgnify:CR=1 FL=1
MDRSEKSRILQDRGTSPGLETSQDAGGSRIGRASDIYSVRKTTYFQPNTQEMSSQTEAYYLKDRNSEAVDSFDLYDHVKKSFQYTSYSDKSKATSVNERLEKQKEKEELRGENLEELDASISSVVEALRWSGRYNNSVIIFLSDNGAREWSEPSLPNHNAPFRGGKGTVYEGGTRIPGFVHSPLRGRGR